MVGANSIVAINNMRGSEDGTLIAAGIVAVAIVVGLVIAWRMTRK